jgi:leader peptidase (prepilin peptidase)/N-methyltransferase
VIRPPRDVVAARGADEWSVLADSWASAAPVIRCGWALATAITLVASIAGAIPMVCGLTVATVMPTVLIDVQVRRIPDVWVGGGTVVLLLATGVSWSVGGPSGSLGDLTRGALLMGMPVLVLHLCSPASMGFGDVKLALLLGATVGAFDWLLAVPALTLAAGSTASVGVAMRARHVPFAPGLVGGTLIALLAHDVLVRT